MRVPVLPNGMVGETAVYRSIPRRPKNAAATGKKRGPYKKPRMLKDRMNTRKVPPTVNGLLSVLIYLPRWKRTALQQLARDTQESQSRHMREAIEGVLRKHGAM